MDAYERIVASMRKNGKYHNSQDPFIGIVNDDKGTILVDGMKITTKDYLMNSNLRIGKEKVFLHTEKPAQEGTYFLIKEHNDTLEEYKANLLEKGDKVLMIKMDKKEQFIVLMKVVNP